MELVVANDYEDLSQRTADVVAGVLLQKPNAVLVFPTGSTPLGLFRVLSERAQRGEINFEAARLVALDEYHGISLDDERNLFRWLDQELIQHVGIPAENIIRFNSAARDIDAELARVEDGITAFGGIDLQILGLGPNGHIALNEPGSAFDVRARLVDLTPESIASNARYWGDENRVPRQGLTLGLGTMSSARQSVLIVSGESKAAILEQVWNSPPSRDLPATWLHTLANVSVIADKAAAQRLTR